MRRLSDPGCCGMCTTASDIGVEEYGDAIADPLPDCPAHGWLEGAE